MTTLYITRHGETEWNTEGRMQGWNDSPLTKLGIHQAHWLYERLKDIDFNVIYSSPTGRAYKTAEILKGEKNIEIIAYDALKELNLSQWEGLDQKSIKDKDEEQFHNYWKAPHLYKPLFGESFLELQNRITAGIKEIVKNHKDETVLIVTHTMTLKALMAGLNNKHISTMWDPPFIKQTSLTIIEMDEDKVDIKMYADDSHHKEITLD
ncbi:histidine phosphatase family protein [Clostridium sp. CS001]|uniref:histidine phosphatase family protein n=1 Tax=Clostridium sp. CS001 TaxID=2880648 RepID=UPI001CF17B66|nr:histidine phosphatase family protein [Clostridium sp. CS001]MCB2290335.1 histidine phosphatase family protein [Clostridium sp. CS001]